MENIETRARKWQKTGIHLNQCIVYFGDLERKKKQQQQQQQQ